MSFVYANYYPTVKIDGAVFDPATSSLAVIDKEHLESILGNGYVIATRFNLSNAAGVGELLLVTPSDRQIHLHHFTIAGDGTPFDIDLFEGTTVSDNGTVVTPKNVNRDSSNISALATYISPTVTSDGTLLEPVLVPVNSNSGALGSDGKNEWILKPGTIYLVRVTNNTTGAGSSRFVINLFFYE